MTLIPSDWHPHKENLDTENRDVTERKPLRTQQENSHPQAKERASRETRPADTLNSGFWPPGCKELCCSTPHSTWYFVTGPRKLTRLPTEPLSGDGHSIRAEGKDTQGFSHQQRMMLLRPQVSTDPRAGSDPHEWSWCGAGGPQGKEDKRAEPEMGAGGTKGGRGPGRQNEEGVPGRRSSWPVMRGRPDWTPA